MRELEAFQIKKKKYKKCQKSLFWSTLVLLETIVLNISHATIVSSTFLPLIPAKPPVISSM